MRGSCLRSHQHHQSMPKCAMMLGGSLDGVTVRLSGALWLAPTTSLTAQGFNSLIVYRNFRSGVGTASGRRER